MRTSIYNIPVLFLALTFAIPSPLVAGPKVVVVNGQARNANKVTLPNGVPAFVEPETPPANEGSQAPMVDVSDPTTGIFQGSNQQVRHLVFRNGVSYTIADQVPEGAPAYEALSELEKHEFINHRINILKGIVVALNSVKWVSGAVVAAGDLLDRSYTQLNISGPPKDLPSSATQRGVQQALTFLDGMLWKHANIVADEHEYYLAALRGKGAGALIGKYGVYGQGCWGIYLAYNPTRKEFRASIITDLAHGIVGGVAQITSIPIQAFAGIRSREVHDLDLPLQFRQYNLPGPLVGTNSPQDFSIGYTLGVGTLPPMIADKLPVSAATKLLIEDFPADAFYSYALNGTRVTLAGFSYSPVYGAEFHSNFFNFLQQIYDAAKAYMVNTSLNPSFIKLFPDGSYKPQGEKNLKCSLVMEPNLNKRD